MLLHWTSYHHTAASENFTPLLFSDSYNYTLSLCTETHELIKDEDWGVCLTKCNLDRLVGKIEEPILLSCF